MSLWFVPKGAQREPSSEQNDQPAGGLCHSSGTCGSPTKLVEQLSEAKNLAAALEPSEASGDQLANPGPWLKELLRRSRGVLRSQSPAAGIEGRFWRNRTPPKFGALRCFPLEVALQTAEDSGSLKKKDTAS